MLRQDLSDRPGSLEYVDEMQKSIASLENVISNILQFAKGGNGANMTPVNLHALLHEQVNRLNPRGASVVTIECAGNPFIRGNEHSLRQLFYNLILNGLQAVRYKGQVHIIASEKEQGIEIHISDNGPGIKPELMDNLFEPFVTGRAEGTGLGLAIVQQVVREHQARIEVRSGNGATFSLFFPKLPIAVIQSRSINGSSAQFSSALETHTREDTNDT